MGIRVSCPGCGKHLNLKSFLAGKRGVCPACQAKFDIPGEDVVRLETRDEQAKALKASRKERKAKAQAAGTTAAAAVSAAATMAPSPATLPATGPAGAPSFPPSTGPAFAAPVGLPSSVSGGIPAASTPVFAAPAAAPFVNPTPAQPAMGSAPVLANPAMAGPVAASPVFSSPASPVMGGPTMAATAASLRDPIAENLAANWYVRPPSGGQYGPAAGDIFRQWLNERRVTPDSLVWREGWGDWQRADAALSMYFGAQAQGAAVPSLAAAGVAPVVAMPGMAAPAVGIAGPVAAAAGPVAYPQLAAQPAMAAAAAPGLGIEAAVPTAPRRTTYKPRSKNGQMVALTILILAVLILAPLLGYVLMQQF
jgi:hypothetical protein